jgi:hypothetical protein
VEKLDFFLAKAEIGHFDPPELAMALSYAVRNSGVASQVAHRFHAAIRRAIPIGNIESASTFPAKDELLVKSFKRPAIKTVRFNGSNNSEFTI